MPYARWTLDKAANAQGLRRPLEPITNTVTAMPETGIAPLLKQMIADYAATGLPPVYLPARTSPESTRSVPHPCGIERHESIPPVVRLPAVAAVGNARMFKRGRDMVAWLGLVPRQFSTRRKPTLGPKCTDAPHFGTGKAPDNAWLGVSVENR